MIQSLNMALSHPIPYSASGCHHMSQRANACHCPEVTRELNCFSCTTSPRTKPRGPRSQLKQWCARSAFGERLQKSHCLPQAAGQCGAPRALRLLRVLDDRSAQCDPHQLCPQHWCAGGTAGDHHCTQEDRETPAPPSGCHRAVALPCF